MAKIELLNLKIENFKGIKKADFNFYERSQVCADNGVGKTTIVDAFTWLLFDKDSLYRKEFNLKPIVGGEELHKAEHIVEATLRLNGVEELKLKKVYYEKWVRQRGKAEEEFKGNTSDYYIDDVKVNQKVFNGKLAEFISEDVFRILTNPTFFLNMKWQEQRKILFSLVEKELSMKCSFSELVKNNSEFIKIEKAIEKYGDEANKNCNTEIKNVKEQLKVIPSVIKNLQENIVEIDVDSLTKQKDELKLKINSLNSNNNTEYEELKEKYEELKKELEINRYKEVNRLGKEIRNLENECYSSENKINRFKKDVEEIENLVNEKTIFITELRERYKKEASKTAEDNICLSCKRPLDVSPEEFIELKKEILAEINIEGKTLNVEIENLKNKMLEIATFLSLEVKKLKDIKDDLKEKRNILINLQSEKVTSDELKSLNVKLIQLSNKNNNNNNNNAEKEELVEKLLDIEAKLQSAKYNNKFQKQIEFKMEEEKTLAQKLANLEGLSYLLSLYNIEKCKVAEELINSKFEKVKFKLFDNKINGSITETCEAVVNDVPISNVNTAGRINASLNIIDTLINHYNLKAPIFIDNRESINDLYLPATQTIALKVGTAKNLTVKEDK